MMKKRCLTVEEKKRLYSEYTRSNLPLAKFARKQDPQISETSTRRIVDLAKSGKLDQALPHSKRIRSSPYSIIENLLKSYIEYRYELYKKGTGRTGLDYATMQAKSLEWGQEWLDDDDKTKFKASFKCISQVLKRSGIKGINLYGEGNELNDMEAEEKISLFRKEFWQAINDHDIPPERIYNADQTGLFTKNYPKECMFQMEKGQLSKERKQ